MKRIAFISLLLLLALDSLAGNCPGKTSCTGDDNGATINRSYRIPAGELEESAGYIYASSQQATRTTTPDAGISSTCEFYQFHTGISYIAGKHSHVFAKGYLLHIYPSHNFW